jgi:hypothetical protein
MKSIVEQIDALHAPIWLGLLPSSYATSFCGLMFPIRHHNMKIKMEKRKAK